MMTPRKRRLTRTVPAGLAAIALGIGGLVGATMPAAAAPNDSWYTSFETGEPGLDGTTIGTPNNTRGKGVPGNVTGRIIPSSIRSNGESGAEGPDKLVDGSTGTKWLSRVKIDTWVSFEIDAPASIETYSLVSANDAAERDPKAFRIEGSADGNTWETIDRQENVAFTARFQKKTFELEEASESYKFFRLYVEEIADFDRANSVQIAELELIEGGASNAATPVALEVNSGPTTGVNIRTGVGFTGARALGYSGGHIAGGPADSESFIAKDIDVEVKEGTELSFKQLYDLTLDYAGGYGAIDLIFDDGKRMSELGLKDTYGFVPSSQTWGDGDLLIPAQWNSLHVDLSPLKGKIVKDVIFTYHNANRGTEETSFRGWFDDIRIGEVGRIDQTTSDLASLVDTRRGSASSGGYSRGLNIPAAAMPNGFNFYAPATSGNNGGAFYSYSASNNSANLPSLQAFLISHEPSHWMGDRNQLAVMPSPNVDPDVSLGNRALAFKHDNEIARPDLYQVTFENGLTAKIAPADHSAVYRFDMPDTRGSVIVDVGQTDGAVGGGNGLAINKDTGEVTGWVDYGSGLSAGRSRMFVYGKFNKDISSVKDGGNGRSFAHTASFADLTDKQVELRIATSFISSEQAKKNLSLEVEGVSFEDVQAGANRAWNERLSVIDALDTNAQDQQITTIYSNLYRLNLYPNSQHENTGTNDAPVWKHASPVAAKSGNASATETNAQIIDGKIYVNNGFWDTYRTAWPLYSFLYPTELVDELVGGFAQQYREGGWIARWSSPGYADLMTGTSSDVAFAEAYLAGKLSPETALDAYDAGLKNSTVRSVSTQAYGANQVGRKGIDQSIFLGYTTNAVGQSVSWGMEGYVNDFGLSKMAEKLANDPKIAETHPERVEQLREEAEYLSQRASAYVNMFDPQVVQPHFDGSTVQGGFAPKDPSGKFVEGANLDPMHWGGAYTEGNGWTFFYHALHDAEGMAALYNEANGSPGGNKAIIDSLNAYFSQPDLDSRSNSQGIHEAKEARDLRMGQWGLSNQISYHVPYIAAAVGKPSMTQEKVREATQRVFQGSDIGQGYVGDEDNGAFSAWHLFSALGFYPLEVGSANYTIGSPMLDKVTLWPGSDKELVISAPGAQDGKVYVDGVSLNGTALDRAKLDGAALRAGGELTFQMADAPSTWGEFQPNEDVRLVLPDLFTPDKVDIRSNDDSDLSGLSDNTSSTSVTFEESKAEITIASKAGSVGVSRYTLTAASEGKPVAWKLEGSTDGKTWKTVDERSNQTFRWANQTRPFEVEDSSEYSQFRLTIEADEEPLTLSEIEMFAHYGESEDVVVIGKAVADVRVGQVVDANIAELKVPSGLSASDFDVKARIVGIDDSEVQARVTRDSAGLLHVKLPEGYKFDEPGIWDIVVTATQKGGEETALTGSGTATIVSYRNDTLAGSFNRICITDKGKHLGNCDGLNFQFDRAELNSLGFKQGEIVPSTKGTGQFYNIPAVEPGMPDNITDDGGVIPLDLPDGVTKLSLIATSNEGAQSGTIVVKYSDDSTQNYNVSVPDWFCPGGEPSNAFVQAKNRYAGANIQPDQRNFCLYETPSLSLKADDGAGNPIHPVSLTMPQSPNGNDLVKGRMHIFAVGTDVNEPWTYVELALTAREDAEVESPQPLEGQIAELTAGDVDSVTVNWGDGTGSETVGVGEGGEISSSHVYEQAGVFTVRILADDGQKSAVASFKVTVTKEIVYTPTISAVPSSVSGGKDFTIIGEGFAPGETVAVSYGDVKASATATIDGTISFTGKAPTKPGDYTITVLGEVSEVSVETSIKVTEAEETPDPGPEEPGTEGPNAKPKVERYAGADRYDTSRLVIGKHLKKGSPLFVATGADFADVLSVAPAAAKADAGVLLLPNGDLDDASIKIIKEKAPSKVIIAGGPNSVSKQTEKGLRKVVKDVSRVYGADRYMTSQGIFEEFFADDKESSHVFVATGLGYADALAGSSAAGANGSALVLVRGNGSAKDSAGMIKTLKSSGIKTVSISGGFATVNRTQETALRGSISSVERIFGADRYETASKLAQWVDKFAPADKVTDVWVTSGLTFPDALSAASFAGNPSARLVLAKPDCVPGGTADVVATYKQAGTLHVVGGTATLAKSVETLNRCE